MGDRRLLSLSDRKTEAHRGHPQITATDHSHRALLQSSRCRRTEETQCRRGRRWGCDQAVSLHPSLCVDRCFQDGSCPGLLPFRRQQLDPCQQQQLRQKNSVLSVYIDTTLFLDLMLAFPQLHGSSYYRPVIPALGRQRFKVIPSYKAHLSSARGA